MNQRMRLDLRQMDLYAPLRSSLIEALGRGDTAAFAWGQLQAKISGVWEALDADPSWKVEAFLLETSSAESLEKKKERFGRLGVLWESFCEPLSQRLPLRG